MLAETRRTHVRIVTYIIIVSLSCMYPLPPPLATPMILRNPLSLAQFNTGTGRRKKKHTTDSAITRTPSLLPPNLPVASNGAQQSHPTMRHAPLELNQNLVVRYLPPLQTRKKCAVCAPLQSTYPIHTKHALGREKLSRPVVSNGLTTRRRPDHRLAVWWHPSAYSKAPPAIYRAR